jgi:hypothetical protein
MLYSTEGVLMSMQAPTLESLIGGYSQLPEEKQVLALCYVAFALTVKSREAYPEAWANEAEAPTQAQSLKILRTSNELQHQLSQHIGHLLRHDVNRYPDDVIVRILLEKGGNWMIAHLHEAVHRSAE